MASNVIYKTQPGYIAIGVAVIGTAFSSFLAYLIWSMNAPTAKDEYVKLFVFFIFASFALLCFVLGLSLRIFYLTENELIIERPVFFLIRRILVSDIVKITEADQKISVARGLGYDEYLGGTKATLYLKNGKKIKFESIAVWGYSTLIKKIRTQIRLNNAQKAGYSQNH